MVEEKDEVELMDYAKELKFLERIGDRIEVSNHWLCEILKVLKEIRNDGFEVTIPENQQKTSKESETEELQTNVSKDTTKETFIEKTDIKKLFKIKVDTVKELENSYMLKEKGLVAFIGKKLVETATGDTVFLTDAAQHWFTEDHIKWKKDDR